jgi:hypothetical protein
MDYDSFSHGQIKSKLWLCEKLEPYLPNGCVIQILGSWYNILGFMLSVRNPDKYRLIQGSDIDTSAIDIADRITNAWTIDNTIQNVNTDSNTLQYIPNGIVINCSPEHFENTEWFDNIPEGMTVCIQSSNMTNVEYPWHIRQPTPSMHHFLEKYPLSVIQYNDTLDITYDTWGYSRYMIIGIK